MPRLNQVALLPFSMAAKEHFRDNPPVNYSRAKIEEHFLARECLEHYSNSTFMDH